MTTDTAPSAAAKYQEARQIQLLLAKGSFPHFLRWVVTLDDSGDYLPAPVACDPSKDPLLPYILKGEIQPRPDPWPHVLDMANDWQAGRSVIYLKARQMWFSWNVAAYALWTAMRKGNVFVVSMSEKYANAVIDKCKVIYKFLPTELKAELVRSNMTELAFKDAGSIMSFPSTEDAVRSLSGRLVIVDEAAFHKYAAENYRAYRPSIAGSGGQLIMISTANGPFGFYHQQFEAARKGESDYDWRFYPWTARPDHDQKWYDHERRMYPGLEADFLRENPATPEEAFAQLSGTVYPSFDPQVHVARARTPWEECIWQIGGVDWGGSPGNPNVAIVLGMDKDGHVHQYAEFTAPEGTMAVDGIGGFLSQWKAKRRLQSVECDWQQNDIDILKAQFSLPARKALKKREGIANLEFLLKHNRFTIEPTCYRSIDEFMGYRWREALDPNTKERYQTSTPVDHHADLMDARRYALQRIWKQVLTSGKSVGTVSGRAQRRSAV